MSMHDRLWALAPELAESVFEAYRKALSPQEGQAAQTAPPNAAAADIAAVAGQITRMVGNVAVISVAGPIDRSTCYSCWSGQILSVGQDAIRSALAQAMQNPAVDGVLLSFNSPGGVVSGTKELADYISSLRDEKPLAAYADGLCASAAFWLAAATGRVFAPTTGQVGSIGVIMEVADMSGYYRAMGVDLQYIASGKWKTAGREAKPLTDDERAYFQERISALHAVFRADVAAHLRIAAPQEQWADAQIFLAPQARDVGLVSAIVRDEEAAVTNLMEVSMPNITREALAKDAPELLAALIGEGKAAAEAAAKANAEATAKDNIAQAAKTGREGALAAMRLVCDEKSVAAVTALIGKAEALQLSPTQLAGMAELLPAAATSHAQEAAPTPHSQLLAALAAAHVPPVNADTPRQQQQSALVADAERRAQAAR